MYKESSLLFRSGAICLPSLHNPLIEELRNKAVVTTANLEPG